MGHCWPDKRFLRSLSPPALRTSIGHGPNETGPTNTKTLPLDSENDLSGRQGTLLGLSKLASMEAGPLLRGTSALRSTLGKR